MYESTIIWFIFLVWLLEKHLLSVSNCFYISTFSLLSHRGQRENVKKVLDLTSKFVATFFVCFCPPFHSVAFLSFFLFIFYLFFITSLQYTKRNNLSPNSSIRYDLAQSPPSLQSIYSSNLANTL